MIPKYNELQKSKHNEMKAWMIFSRSEVQRIYLSVEMKQSCMKLDLTM